MSSMPPSLGFRLSAQIGPITVSNFEGAVVRRVRFQYPQAYVELVQLLTVDANRRLVASTLSLPLSTVYRWAKSGRSPDWATMGWTRSKNSVGADYINTRLEICKKHGFDIKDSV